MLDASPVKWHLAHSSWFFERLVLMEQPGYRPFDPAYLYLFNSYYEGLGPRHPRSERGLLSRPSLEEVIAYRAHVDAAMAKLLAALNEGAAEEKTIELGLHHEQQHQELILTDIKHALFANPLLPAYAADAPMPPPCGKAAWIAHPGGLVEVGHRGETFCFDNEQPAHPVMLRPFRIQSRPVSNGDFLAFIQDGGYRRPEFWLSDGWGQVQSEKWEAPLYWLKDDDGEPSRFSLGGIPPLNPRLR